MANILFGDANPGGHLPVNARAFVGQLPMFYNYSLGAHRGYLFDTTAPAVPVRIRSELTRASMCRAQAFRAEHQAGRVGRCFHDVKKHGCTRRATRSCSSTSRPRQLGDGPDQGIEGFPARNLQPG